MSKKQRELKCEKCGHSMKNHLYESFHEFGCGGGRWECGSCYGGICTEKKQSKAGRKSCGK